MRRYFTATACFFLGLWLALMIVGRSSLFRDPGTFWHTVLGEQMLLSQQLVKTNTLTFTMPGEPWLALQWLAEMMMALAHAAGGWDGELLLAVSLIAGTYAWVASRFLRLKMNAVLVALILLIVLGASAHHFHVRPHLASILMMGLTAAILVDVESGRVPIAKLWWLPPLFVLWTNLHGGVLAGLAYVYIAAFGWSAALLFRLRSPLQSIRDMSHLTGCLLAITVALFINPYGRDMPAAWLSIMRMNLPEMIEEHAPLNFTQLEAWMVLLLLAIYLRVLFSAWFRQQRIVWLLPLFWFLLAWSRVRHAPLFAIVTAVSLADALPLSNVFAWLKRSELVLKDVDAASECSRDGSTTIDEHHQTCGAGVPPARASSLAPAWHSWVVPSLLITLVLVLQVARLPLPVFGRGWAKLSPDRWPTELVAELQRVEASPDSGGRIINSLGLGGFLEYYTPRLKPFIDDRCELFGDKFLKDYVNAETRLPEKVDEWARQYNVRFALVVSHSNFDNYLTKASGWKLLKRDAAAALFERQKPQE